MEERERREAVVEKMLIELHEQPAIVKVFRPVVRPDGTKATPAAPTIRSDIRRIRKRWAAATGGLRPDQRLEEFRQHLRDSIR